MVSATTKSLLVSYMIVRYPLAFIPYPPTYLH